MRVSDLRREAIEKAKSLRKQLAMLDKITGGASERERDVERKRAQRVTAKEVVVQSRIYSATLSRDRLSVYRSSTSWISSGTNSNAARDTNNVGERVSEGYPIVAGAHATLLEIVGSEAMGPGFDGER
jgi:hypothetical protein